MVNIENEYYALKAELKQEQEKLAKFEATEIVEDENNPFTIEERTEAKNRGIKSCKETITEIKELLDEVTGELHDFIKNGGEVSNETLKELKEEETSSNDSFSIDFKVQWNKNPQVYFEGYVNIPSDDCEDEEIKWYYYNDNGFATSQKFIEHDGVDGFKGSTDEQQFEIDQFKDDFLADSLWIDVCICQSDADENRTYVRENCTLIINEGAKMEVEIVELPETHENFIVELVPRFNGEKISLAEFMADCSYSEEFDPWDDGAAVVEDNKIFFEMPKSYFENDDSVKESLMNDINEEARRVYARCLTYDMGIYAKYGDVMEQALDDYYDNDWLFKLSPHRYDDEDELDSFLREEGYIDEELDY